MPQWIDGPASPHFFPLRWKPISEQMDRAIDVVHERAVAALASAPNGDCICRGLPFSLPESPHITTQRPLTRGGRPMRARWLVFQHCCEWPDPQTHAYPDRPTLRGAGGLGGGNC